MPSSFIRPARALQALLLALLLFLGGATTGQAAEWGVAPEVEVTEPPPVPEGWQTVHGLHADFHGPARDHRILLLLATHSDQSLPALATSLQVPLGDRMHVFLTPDERTFRALQPGTPPAWADATAYPRAGLIFLRAPRARGPAARPLEQVLDHEIVHVLLGQAFAPHQPPRWLQEGLAQVLSGEADPSIVRDLARGHFGDRLYSLQELDRAFPGDRHGARVAYAQSADFIAWIWQTRGEDALPVLVHEMARTGDIRQAVHAATGQPLDQVEQAWRARFETGPPLWLVTVGSVEAWWIGMALLAVVALLAKRRRIRRRMHAMAAEEEARDALVHALWVQQASRRPDATDPPRSRLLED